MRTCDFDCKKCKKSKCVLDVEEKHKPRKVSDKQKAYWEKRKNTLTDRQRQAIEIYNKYQNTGGNKSNKEYLQAYYIVRYLRDRERMLQQKKDRYKSLYLLEES